MSYLYPQCSWLERMLVLDVPMDEEIHVELDDIFRTYRLTRGIGGVEDDWADACED